MKRNTADGRLGKASKNKAGAGLRSQIVKLQLQFANQWTPFSTELSLSVSFYGQASRNFSTEISIRGVYLLKVTDKLKTLSTVDTINNH